MRYGCKHINDASSESFSSKSTGSQTRNSNRKTIKQRRRSKSRDVETKRGAAKDAAKRSHRRETISKVKRWDYTFVYVGNIDPSISERRLHEYFSKCGKVYRIQLRCSRGQAINIGVPVPKNVRTSRDRQYATIEFKDYRGARNALHLNGKELDGCELVVTISPTDLPEVQDIVDMRISEIKKRTSKTNVSDELPRASARPLEKRPTEEVIDVAQTCRADRHRIFGISFAKCVA